MPYLDPEKRRAAHRKSDRKARVKQLRAAVRFRRYNASDKGIAARTRYNRSPKGRAALLAAKARYRARVRQGREDRATELQRLIAEQARDARTFQIKKGPDFLDLSPARLVA